MMSRLVPRIIVFIALLIYSTGSSGSNLRVGEPKIRCREVERKALVRIKDFLYNSAVGTFPSSWGTMRRKESAVNGTESRATTNLVMPSSLIFRMSRTVFSLEILSSTLVKLFGPEWPLCGWKLHPKLHWSARQIKIKCLETVSRLSSLRLLDLTNTDRSMAYDWVRVVNDLPHLRYLELSCCGLPDIAPPSLSLVNSSKFLSDLDLSRNLLSSSVFQWLFNYSRCFVHLDLSYSLLNTSIPNSFGNNLAALQSLRLVGNELEGYEWETDFYDPRGSELEANFVDPRSNRFGGLISKYFGNMTALLHLDLSSNQLEGSIPEVLGNMTFLEYLDLSNNMLSGEIPKSIWKLSALQQFRAYNNGLTGQLQFAESASSWRAHFPLEYLDLGKKKFMGLLPNFTLYPSLKRVLLNSNQLIGNVLESPRQLSKLEHFHIANNSIVDVISEAHFSKLFNLSSLDLSSNSYLVFDISTDWIPPFQLDCLGLGGCKGTIQANQESIPPRIGDIDLSSNHLEGPLSGELPDCWSQVVGSSLRVLILGNNKLSGKIPSSVGFLTGMEILHLGNNNLTAELPSSLRNCTELVIFDVGENNLLRTMPKWIRKSLTKLVILSLRSNNFNGNVPWELCHSVHLQLLDLSSNNLSSNIPNCLGNITSMKEIGGTDSAIKEAYDSLFYCCVPSDFYNEKLVLEWKGALLAFKNFGLLKNVELLSNKLLGDIPREITQLIGLVSLNLSRNNLSKILTGAQLQAGDANAYIKNPELCGDTLPKKCPREEPIP
ncbi:hypothetical protein TIFTF001_038736 [Ficus carica]|uniref:Uncharacterized protein n=1 Tax=Ficus carica TaxID=3494 RepID=A0AA88E7U7_FICCA|nr:hypothetical protein TIFTF001_038736 [Ficus carica]